MAYSVIVNYLEPEDQFRDQVRGMSIDELLEVLQMAIGAGNTIHAQIVKEELEERINP